MQFKDTVVTFFVSPSKVVHYVITKGVGFEHANNFTIENLFVFSQIQPEFNPDKPLSCDDFCLVLEYSCRLNIGKTFED
jgi:hypothetical protein